MAALTKLHFKKIFVIYTHVYIIIQLGIDMEEQLKVIFCVSRYFKTKIKDAMLNCGIRKRLVAETCNCSSNIKSTSLK